MRILSHRIILATLVVEAISVAAASDERRRPNILWICTDQQRFDTIAALGNPHIRTPNLDRLIATGVSFTRAYVQNTVCTPSRSSFLTGRYPASIRAMQNGNATFADAAPLLTKVLADAGYFCGLVGKLHLASAFHGPEKRVDDGYAWMRYSHDPRTTLAQGNEYWRWLYSKGVELDAVFERSGNSGSDGLGFGPFMADLPSELHHTTWCTDEAIEFIGSQAREPGRPWLLSVNYFSPHPPFDPPAAYRRRYDATRLPGPHVQDGDFAHEARLEGVDFQSRAQRRDPAAERKQIALYYAMIEQVDDNLGRLLDVLESAGLREHTLVIFSTDHGDMLGDHGLRAKGCRFYEGLVRVPLIFSWPGTFAQGHRVDELVEYVDIAPTLYEAAGVVGPRRLDGRSLGLWLRPGETPAAGTHREFVRCEYYHTLELPGFKGSYATMIRDQRFKCAVYHDREYGELYDLQADPWEHRNLWESREHRDVRDRLIRRAFDSLVRSIDLGPERVGRY